MGEMHILKLREGEEYIKLGQALKATGLADSGIDAKEIIQQGLVLVNGEIDDVVEESSMMVMKSCLMIIRLVFRNNFCANEV